MERRGQLRRALLELPPSRDYLYVVGVGARGLGQLVVFVPKRFAGITIIVGYRHCLVNWGLLRDPRRYN